MRKENAEKRAVSRKRSIEDLKAMSLKEYTDLLTREMVKNLNNQTVKRLQERALDFSF